MVRVFPGLNLLSAAVSLFFYTASSQTIGSFNSIQPTAQTQQLVLPATHTFQRIIKSGDNLSLGGTLGGNPDFTGYVPILNSTHGYLSINSETNPAECAVLEITFNNSSKLWEVNNGGKVNLPLASLGRVGNLCSGAVTPRNTVMVCEEITTNMDLNGDGYQDLGWVLEIDPATRTVINQDNTGGPDKLWAVGRQVHENVALKANESVMYWGADVNPTGYLYKFVPDVAANYTSGSLYVLETTASLGTGTWKIVPNATQAQRNNTVAASTGASAYDFNGIEDVEIGPDGKIYFAAKTPGRIYRFRDLGNTVDQLEVFVESTSYDVDGAGPYSPESWGTGNDNLAFDNEGNLWVLQDGGRNHIWTVGPSHTSLSPDVRLFATTPAGSEPTGITFTPDNNFLFMSFMHPSASNSQSQNDASGTPVVFNTGTTVVVARKEQLGQVAVPLLFKSLDLQRTNEGIAVLWETEGTTDHAAFYVERSEDGIRYEVIQVDLTPLADSAASFAYLDKRPSLSPSLQYRIKQCNKDGSCKYSPVRTIQIELPDSIQIFPNPVAGNLSIEYTSRGASRLDIRIIDLSGTAVAHYAFTVRKGLNILQVQTTGLSNGNYFIAIRENDKTKRTIQFSKN